MKRRRKQRQTLCGDGGCATISSGVGFPTLTGALGADAQLLRMSSDGVSARLTLGGLVGTGIPVELHGARAFGGMRYVGPVLGILLPRHVASSDSYRALHLNIGALWIYETVSLLGGLQYVF
jgi:hypothetical protein